MILEAEKRMNRLCSSLGSREDLEPPSSKGEVGSRIHTVKSSKEKKIRLGNGSSSSGTGVEKVFLAVAAKIREAGRELQRSPIVSCWSRFLPSSWLSNCCWRQNSLCPERLAQLRACKCSKDRFRKCMHLECCESSACQLLILFKIPADH